MPQVGVCSWSLLPDSPRGLASAVKACGLDAVQLSLDPIRTGLWKLPEVSDVFASSGLRLLSGMMSTVGEDYSSLESIRRTGGLRPDEHWPANLEAAQGNASIAAQLGLSLVTLHAGFLPHDPSDSLRGVMIERLRQVLRVFAVRGIRVGFETGQEDAATLLSVLHELRDDNPGINFDPANMILYGMGDPVAAFRQLAPFVVQVHIKDAIPTPHPGEWGREVVVGAGAVDWPAFLALVKSQAPDANMIIEREAGTSRVEDVRLARGVLQQIGGI